MKQLDYVLRNRTEVLNFLRSRFPMYHQSNFFFRDLQFGIQAMLEEKKMNVNYAAAENIARSFALKLESEKIFVRIDHQTWVVSFPEFKKPVVKPAAPAKPAVAAKPVPSAAAAPVQPGTTATPAAAKEGPESAGGTTAAPLKS